MDSDGAESPDSGGRWGGKSDRSGSSARLERKKSKAVVLKPHKVLSIDRLVTITLTIGLVT